MLQVFSFDFKVEKVCVGKMHYKITSESIFTCVYIYRLDTLYSTFMQ